jgi:photosynthetic reaction center cytochrome c subunit
MSSIKVKVLRLTPLLLFVTAVLTVIIDRTSAQNPTTTTAPAEKTVEQTRTNIQVLKGLPDSQLIPVMNFMGASLGVRCTYCHVNKDGKWDFGSDEKAEKKTAREMITMVMGINKGNFRGNPEVSCYTCHRGRTSVVHTLSVPVPTPEPRPSPAASPTASQQPNPTAEQIFDKYYQAVGGTEAIDKLKSRVMKGTLITGQGTEVGYELNQAGPDSVLAVLTTPQGVIQRALQGATGWEKSDRGVRDLTDFEIGYVKRYSLLYADLKLKDQFSRISFGGKQKIDERDVYAVRATTTGGKRETLFFDVETGLLTRRTSSTTTPVGTIPEQVDYADYKDVDGMKLPFTIRFSAVDPSFSGVRKFTEIKLNVPVDPKRFNKPA